MKLLKKYQKVLTDKVSKTQVCAHCLNGMTFWSPRQFDVMLKNNALLQVAFTFSLTYIENRNLFIVYSFLLNTGQPPSLINHYYILMSSWRNTVDTILNLWYLRS